MGKCAAGAEVKVTVVPKDGAVEAVALAVGADLLVFVGDRLAESEAGGENTMIKSRATGAILKSNQLLRRPKRDSVLSLI